MAKGSKAKTVTAGHLHSRVTFLHQAATYLAHASTVPKSRAEIAAADGSHVHQVLNEKPDKSKRSAAAGSSNRLLFHLLRVSRKGQIRLPRETKHSICKHCGTLLIPGSNVSSRVENESMDGKKLWTNVLVQQCDVCNCTKRFPVGATRQTKRVRREKARISLSAKDRKGQAV